MADAFSQLRRFARSTNQRLSDVASAVVHGEVVLDPLTFVREVDVQPEVEPSSEQGS